MKATARRLVLVLMLLAAAPASEARLLPIVDVGPARPNEVATAVEVAAGVDGTFLVLWASTDQAGEAVALATRQLAAVACVLNDEHLSGHGASNEGPDGSLHAVVRRIVVEQELHVRAEPSERPAPCSRVVDASGQVHVRSRVVVDADA